MFLAWCHLISFMFIVQSSWIFAKNSQKNKNKNSQSGFAKYTEN